MKKLPPLNSLKAFYVVSKYQNFTKAAEELHITPGAVSHQVKQLEETIGSPLFRRLPRGVALTAEGKSLIFEVQKAFEILENLGDQFWTPTPQTELYVTTVSGFASCVILPRLAEFQTANPGISLNLNVDQRFFAKNENRFDIGIRYGRGKWAGLKSKKLPGSEKLLVCAPDLINRQKTIKPKDLGNFPLIGNEGPQDWISWLSLVGSSNFDPKFSLVVDDYMVGLTAARKGLGFYLTHRILVQEDLETGALVAPFKKTLPSEIGYYFIVKEGQVLSEPARLFMDWVLKGLPQSD